jgi:caa(3)-type oxidase subunit IV
MATTTTTTTRIDGRSYVIAWLGLLVLTVLSFAASRLGLGHAASAAVALVIATIKAAWVALIFMHLLEARFSQRVTISVAVAFVVLLCWLMVADVETRHTLPPLP